MATEAVLAGPVPRRASSGAVDPAVVRRADWRFLLPAGLPSRAAFLGPGGSPGRAALEAVCEDVVFVASEAPPDPVDRSGFELVVAEGTDPTLVRRAASIVARGGFLYLEVDRRTASGWRTSLGRTTRRLAALGFTDVEIYWHYPSFERRRRIIHLSAMRVGIAHLRRGHDKLPLRILAVGAALPGIRNLLPRLLPCVSLLARRSSGKETVQ